MNMNRNMNMVGEITEDSKEWEMRPGGMLVQKREHGFDVDDNNNNHGVHMIKIKISYGSSLHDFTLPYHTTFGELKQLLAPITGLQPEDQKLFFRGREKDDSESLHMAGLKDLSKLLLLERPASKERKMEEAKKNAEILRACEAISEVRAEVDKISQKVSALQEAVHSGKRVNDKEFIIATELLMVQLLKLDSIEADGEAKSQRKNEVRRVQGFVDMLDGLKVKNGNPFGISSSSTVSVSTNWETFDSGVGSLTPPSVSSPPAKVTPDWEHFE